jgi:putative Holliday junction resolvase
VISELKDLALSREVKGIVFGVPWYHLSGDINPKATLFLSIGRRLNILLGLPVYFWDEGMTSDQARISIKLNLFRGERKSRASEPIDSLSAALMLQSFLDERVKSRPIEKDRALGEDD